MSAKAYPDHEGLQVQPGDGLEVAPGDGPEVALSDGPEVAPSDGLLPSDIPPTAENGVGGSHAYDPGLEFNDKTAASATAPAAPAAGAQLICGLRRRTMWILLAAAILVAVIVASVVGGVVGSQQAKSSSTSNAIAATATSIVQTAYPTTPFKLDCPAINNTQQKVYGKTFDIYCNGNMSPHSDHLSNATSLTGCIYRCLDLVGEGKICNGVVWNTHMGKDHPPNNCYLKEHTDGFYWDDPPDDVSACAIMR